MISSQNKHCHKIHSLPALPAWLSESTALTVIVTPDSLLNLRLSQEINFFKLSETPVLSFPDWETLPYDHFSPHQDIVSQRLKTLTVLPQLRQGILLVSISTLMQKISPLKFIQAHAFYLTAGQTVDLAHLRKRFMEAGYQSVAQVIAPGEFAVRGSLFDIFPMGSDAPYRIDLLDQEIDSIRVFDVQTQRTLEKIETINLLPAREFALDKNSIALFRQQWRDVFSGKPGDCPLYEAVSQGHLLSGIEYYFPLFFDKTGTLFDYLPAKTHFIKLDYLYDHSEKYWSDIKSRYESLRYDYKRPLLPPEALFLNPTEVFTRLKAFDAQPYDYINIDSHLENHSSAPLLSQSQKSQKSQKSQESQEFLDIFIDHKAADPFEKLKNFLSHLTSRLLFCTESPGRREALLALFHKAGIALKTAENWQSFLNSPISLGVTVSPLEQAVWIKDKNILLIPETLLSGEQISQTRKRCGSSHKNNTALENIIKNLAELDIGAPVVHIDHGAGRYQGLKTLNIDGQENEFLLLEYAGQAKLYVPVARLDLISRYSGVDPEHAPLHKLGTDQWEKAKKKAVEKIHDVSAELLEIHARREMRGGFSHALDINCELFAKSFPFEETPDQAQAINDVIKDMQSSKSMDRLICGDVGFGKTEVAMRAVFIAVQNGFQTAVLVPTTLLAQQHFQNFSDRFADWPVKIEMISRFKTREEQIKILTALRNGGIDIVIGTHKLIQPSVVFKNLGLLIIDEEHRFGVRQKEKLKALRAEVDILTLTATPIPRTLNLSLSGMRDLSLINTPPAKRLSIKTFVCPHNPALIREAALREILRGGQVFYLHNDVQTIMKTAEQLKSFIPEARIIIAHGQMPERELERIMREFYHQQHQILVCTTIIETGIDIPSANTIIIDRADKFGLAQLHQLRGRVGRSHHQAYAYLLTPPHQKIGKQAEKRLEAIRRLEDLGAGFVLASNDLEIRGAGEILGEHQSGSIQEIGFSLYTDLLDRAVKSLKKGEKIDLLLSAGTGVDIDLQMPALIPEDYVFDVHTRLVLYKRLAGAQNHEEVRALKIEFIDRFGLLPAQTQNLFMLADLKLKARRLGILKIHLAHQKNICLEFQEKPSINPSKLILLIQKNPQNYSLNGQNKIKIMQDHPLLNQEKIPLLEQFFEKISV